MACVLRLFRIGMFLNDRSRLLPNATPILYLGLGVCGGSMFNFGCSPERQDEVRKCAFDFGPERAVGTNVISRKKHRGKYLSYVGHEVGMCVSCGSGDSHILYDGNIAMLRHGCITSLKFRTL